MQAYPHSRARKRGRKPANAAFTLFEFLVAFTIFAIFLAAILAALSVALRSDDQMAFLTLATRMAKSKLASAAVDGPLRTGVTNGIAEGGFRWQKTVRPYRQASIGPGQLITGYWVDVTVSDPRNARRSVTLSGIEIQREAVP